MTALLRSEHREIESHLDRLGGALAARKAAAARMAFDHAWPLLEKHYRREESRFFAALRPHFPVLAVKMAQQHDEARELAAHLENPELPEPEWLSLARRFLAIAQHNLIEEERDLFMLAERIPGLCDLTP